MSKPDFLTTDTIIPGQEWIVISFIDGKRLKACKQDFPIMKFRGAFATQEEAGKHATYLQSIDQFCNIYVGPGFTWIPAEDDPDKAKEGKYAEPEMNNLMEKYLINQAKAKELYERRKNEMVMEAVTKNMKDKDKKKKKKASVNEDAISINDLVSTQNNTKDENEDVDVDVNVDVDVDVDEVKAEVKAEDKDAKAATNTMEPVDNSSNDIISDDKSLEEVLKESKIKSATLDAEIIRAKKILGMDIDGFNKAKQIHDELDAKLNHVSVGKY